MVRDPEQVVRAFLAASEGRTQDVGAMVALMSEDVVWQINVPSAPEVAGRENARAEIERQNTVSTGMLPGSQVVALATTEDTVFTERIDIVEIAGRSVKFRINAVFEVRGGQIARWREYFDTIDPAGQLGVAPHGFYEGIGTGQL